jgi:mannosyltransferase OCH1-like enzyme
MVLLEHYTKSGYRKSITTVINAGISNDNIKIITVNQTFKNPKFYPRKFEKYSDTFEIQVIDNNTLKIRRSDVSVGGWGMTLLIDVEDEIDPVKIECLSQQKIPRVIYQTFETYDVPENMYKSIQTWKDLNQDYEHYYFNNNDRIEFIEKYFGKRVLNAYLTLIAGAFKADLWRCCILYEKGGIYVDSDMICLKPFREFININDEFIASRDDPMSKSFVCNGFIASRPKHPFLKEQIDAIVRNVETKANCYYLDLAGPGLLGKSINKVCGVDIGEEYVLGENKKGDYSFKLYMHDWITKTICYNDHHYIMTEYDNKNSEMITLNIPTYYSLYQQGIVYQMIPRDIYYTAADHLSINTYMVNSFTEKNQFWNLHYFNDDDQLSFIEQNNDLLMSELNEDVLSYYLTLTNGGEKADLWRYCVIYLMGGLYVDSDTYCNKPLDEWIKHHDLILGIEACLDVSFAKSFGMDQIGYCIEDTIISVCNWSFAASPKHEFFKNLIIDICSHPITNNIIMNTGPGRMTKHAVDYFSDCNLLSLRKQSITKNKSILYNINKFGSNQSHSNSYKNYSNPFSVTCADDVYIIHMFEGNWRRSSNKKIKFYKSTLGLSHNVTILKQNDGFLGVSRMDKDTSRTLFMKQIGDCRTLLEIVFDSDFNILSENEKCITNIEKISKFEDYRFFTFRNSNYICVSYIDDDFNTKVAVLNMEYKYLGDVKIDSPYNTVSFTGKRKIWEKNWLFFEKDKDLYFIYSTTPNYVVYKCDHFETLQFSKYINIPWPLDKNVPDKEVYFTSYIGSDIPIATGGSTNPIYVKEKEIYIYMIHTKINCEFKYNHYMVILNKDLQPIRFFETPLINKSISHKLFFITTMIETDHYLIISGGIEDNQNFVWELSKEKIFNKLNI